MELSEIVSIVAVIVSVISIVISFVLNRLNENNETFKYFKKNIKEFAFDKYPALINNFLDCSKLTVFDKKAALSIQNELLNFLSSCTFLKFVDIKSYGKIKRIIVENEEKCFAICNSTSLALAYNIENYMNSIKSLYKVLLKFSYKKIHYKSKK